VKKILGSVSGLALVLLAAHSPLARAEDPAHVQILSATVKDQKIGGATVILQKNGEQSSATVTDSGGRAQVPDTVARDPSSLLIVRKAGYSDLVAKCPCGGMTYAVSPILRSLDGMRIVLNWGSSPEDLDAHLSFESDHVYFLKKEGNDALLDVDDTNGFGPETITIARKRSGSRYVYAVQDYSQRLSPDSAALSRSRAKVFVYVGQTLIRTYYVPTNRTGNLWNVFAVSEIGEIQDISAFSGITVAAPSDLTPARVFGVPRGEAVGSILPPSLPVVSGSPLPDSARKLNTLGETAYRQGDYPRAIELFQAAIAQHTGYGQAYSNLGLTFQKTARVAAALWANRKAIALASGHSAATTRASTHFNNGKIYEAARQWNDALREYESAVREKSSAVYENAIQRMRQQGAH
jgi:tetratricopeptide (TPR) repeat protein